MSRLITLEFDEDDTFAEGLIRRMAAEPELAEVVVVEAARDILCDDPSIDEDLIRTITEYCDWVRALDAHIRRRRAAA